MAQNEWDMIDVLDLEVVRAQTIQDVLVLVETRLVIVPAGMSRGAISDRVSRWWAQRPHSPAA